MRAIAVRESSIKIIRSVAYGLLGQLSCQKVQPMGCDIHTFVHAGNRYIETANPFDNRSYGKFAFLAGVRNYSAVPKMPWWGRGFPELPEVSKDDYFNQIFHSATWVMLDELLAFNYDQLFEDLRVMRDGNGGCTAKPGGGALMTYRLFLEEGYFTDLEELKLLQESRGPVRIAYAFDN